MNLDLSNYNSSYFSEHPLVLIDVGASGGLKKRWDTIKKNIQIIGFEPDDNAFKLLRSNSNKKFIYLKKALSDRKGPATFYVAKKQQVSSMLKPNRFFINYFGNPNRYDIVKTTEIQTDTLDNQLKINDLPDPDFIKLDTQGCELSILKGSSGTLQKSVFGLEVEVEFHEFYEKQPLFSDVDKYLRDFGFQLFDLHPCYLKRSAGANIKKTKGQIVFADAIYFKSIDKFDSLINSKKSKTEKKAKVLKAIAICSLYEHHDYALEIFTRFREDFNAKENQLILEQLKQHKENSYQIEKKIRNFRGRKNIADIFWNVWKTIQPEYWKSIIYLKDGQRIERF
jgi:FkbM family methyltransferase